MTAGKKLNKIVMYDKMIKYFLEFHQVFALHIKQKQVVNSFLIAKPILNKNDLKNKILDLII